MATCSHVRHDRSERPRYATRFVLEIAGRTLSIVKRTGTRSESARNVKPMIGDDQPQRARACRAPADRAATPTGRPRSAWWIVYSGSTCTSCGAALVAEPHEVQVVERHEVAAVDDVGRVHGELDDGAPVERGA